MKHGSLFSGIGGFDLASEWMGWENVFQCEYDEFCQTILKYYWPNATLYKDIKETDFKKHRGTIDILTGGFPCQPFSSAGKRQGTEDDRHLWPEMLRAIREIEPQWVVGENVGGIVNWNEGLVFEQVQADLEAEGYEVQPFILPAAAVNAPHRRDRTWFVAYAKCSRKSRRSSMQANRCNNNEPGTEAKILQANNGRNEKMEANNAAHTSGKRLFSRKQETSGPDTNNVKSNGHVSQHLWENWPTQSPVCGGNDGLPSKLDGITFSKWRSESIKGYGNAIVPQVALQLFKAIQEMENFHNG